MAYYSVQETQLFVTATPPTGLRPFAESAPKLLPPQITALHEQLRAWEAAGHSPGTVLPERILLSAQGDLFWYFEKGTYPRPLSHTGFRPTLAAWLLLLDQVMETFVVVARARSVWSPDELAGAIPFLSPAFLPPALVDAAPGQWQHFAGALALAVADGPLRGEPTNRHWASTAPSTREST